jgi:hypothetical protein
LPFLTEFLICVIFVQIFLFFIKKTFPQISKKIVLTADFKGLRAMAFWQMQVRH